MRYPVTGPGMIEKIASSEKGHSMRAKLFSDVNFLKKTFLVQISPQIKNESRVSIIFSVSFQKFKPDGWNLI